MVPDHALYPVLHSSRIVLIIGAGVSLEVGVPTGDRFAEAIDNDGRYGSIVRELLGTTARAAGFFRALAAYRSITGSAVFWEFLRKGLAADDRESPAPISASYELVAHLLYHRRLHAVISLNFDELLDRALALESRSTDPRTTIRATASLSEFSALRDRIGEFRRREAPGALPLRCYLKPHGTISRPTTIRLSLRGIRRFEMAKRNVLRTYLDGAAVVALGWRFADPDLVRILTATRRPDTAAKIVVVRPTATDEDMNLDYFTPVGTTAADYLQCLFDAETSLHKGRRVRATVTRQPSRGDLRHKIRSEFFGSPLGEPKPRFRPNLENQLALEIVMASLKARSHVEPSVLLDCPRILSFIEELQARKSPKTLSSVLSYLSNKRGAPAVFERNMNDKGEPIYWLSPPESRLPDGDLLAAIAARSLETLAGKLWALDRVKPEERQFDALNARLLDSFASLTKTFDVDLAADPRQYAMFSKPIPLANESLFNRATERLLGKLSGRSAHALCVSAYTGEWLQRDPMCRRSILRSLKRVELIVEDADRYGRSPYAAVAKQAIDLVVSEFRHRQRRVHRRTLKAQPGIEVIKLSRKTHNLTAIADKSGRFLAGLYFRRESKTTQVSPVYLHARDDLDVLRNLWDSMWKDPSRIVYRKR